METIVPIPTLLSLVVHVWLVPISLTLVALLKLVAGLVVMMMHGTVVGLVVMMHVWNCPSVGCDADA
ncbi:hypothetical protein IGI04_022737 [Brassica rapa subsp. trilocularis]|uniref:Uncharacterized protein n=1 Tax=Brassica rapa subsp. trilocularis TaxID=1813537 RepID=A0ABQ7M595_BRACM|nr:hypothetical protein IGI04_022737 [Brassica rapa subsp. trilocularis]